MLKDLCKFPSLVQHREPRLRFGSDNPSHFDTHPLNGLLRYGPYSIGKVFGLTNPIRIGGIAPKGSLGSVKRIVNELRAPASPRERQKYLVNWPGFSRIFGLDVDTAREENWIELPFGLSLDDCDPEIVRSEIIDAFSRAIRRLSSRLEQFDVIYIFIPDSWSVVSYSGPDDDFDLHDFIKALAASLGVTTQIINDGRSGALSYRCRCSVMWRLGIASYTKAGGVPWILADLEEGTAFIALDYAIRKAGPAEARFAICCSQVFDSEGAGLEFVAYEERDAMFSGKNPFLSKSQMLKVMASSLSIFQKRNGGVLPKRVIVFKNSEWKDEEIDGCFEALGAVGKIDLIQINVSPGWEGVWFDEKKSASNFPCARGTSIQIGPFEQLLWTDGNAPRIVGGTNYYKSGKGIPRPIMLTRFAGDGAMDEIADYVLALTKMDWNNDGPYDHLPVVLSYAGRLARVVKRMPMLESRPYPFRQFM
ncbi:MAG TPA: hypothetical protein VEB20_07515 [Azospirillaceae bacterium]|nr:hypothetical protein [Azospirillaceae bacterium]